MLQVTQPARERLRAELSDRFGRRSEFFRVFIRENCLEVIRDEVRPGDVTVRDEDDVLLVMDPATADWLSDRKIEYDETISRLVFT